MSKLDKYFRVILNHDSNDWNDKPEYKIQILYSDVKHKIKNQFRNGAGEWEEVKDVNLIYERLEDACGKLILKACKDKDKEIAQLQDQLSQRIEDAEMIAQSNSGLANMVTKKDHQIKILEKALELAVNFYVSLEDSEFAKNCRQTNIDYFKTKAKEMMKSE